ncbi:RidA family protein [bacterium]|nr:RidA family protein [bacterium]
MSDTPESRLAAKGIQIPAAPAAVGAYVPAVQFGNLVVTSGQLPMRDGKVAFTGKVGGDLSVETAAEAAQLCALNCLVQIKAVIGELSRVKRIVRVEGFVNSADGFTSQPAVMNGASHFLADAFGDAGSHTRIAVGANELPLDAAVEVVVWAEVEQVS